MHELKLLLNYSILLWLIIVRDFVEYSVIKQFYPLMNAWLRLANNISALSGAPKQGKPYS